MRISVDENDAGFEAYATAFEDGRVFDVLLDGQRIDDVVTADEVEGFLIRVVPTPSCWGMPLEETLAGTVEIIAKSKPWAADNFRKMIDALKPVEGPHGT
ncbi:hypothetical protein ASG39_11210 [Rhizobium sp. Leaf371]|uniref:hypothetical protein n=1 Tax=Rhizobium sp. Leaf371 TaxID=1736355 RepID=UPI000713CE93|nr:hypothetical protein [Rhizobium sp. Leaf371]KQS64516.1 hypothetical protein ASG39_11210 [Rhizobium sp. Leaf371]